MDCPINALAAFRILLLSYAPLALGATSGVPADSAQEPDLEFLEFLGSFETNSGEWISPAELMQPEFREFLDSARSSSGGLAELIDAQTESTPAKPPEANKD
ncbi:MAG: hypothetical protein R3F50_14425 [Gammaproteobacteria bacterium]|jgi:hypothetical protein